MANTPITDKQIESFRRLLLHLPGNADLVLIILKGHLLIEEQIRQVISERVMDASVLKEAELTCHQAICLAQALCSESVEPILWPCLKKLNKIRNDIAHKIGPKGLRDRIIDLNKCWPSGLEVADEEWGFQLTLCSMFVIVSGLVEKPAAEILKVIPRN